MERLLYLQRVGGIEPPASAWKAEVLPLYDTRCKYGKHRLGQDIKLLQLIFRNRGGQTRTGDLSLPKRAFWPTELRPVLTLIKL